MRRSLLPQEARPSECGIITQRRQPPPSGHVPYRPPPRPVHVQQPASFSWESHLRREHLRWDRRTGVQVRAAEKKAGLELGGDALDELVQIQADRKKRLASMNNAPPFVERLAGRGRPVVPAALGPLDAFAAFVAAGGGANQEPAATKAVFHRHMSPRSSPGLMTRMGLHPVV